MGCAGDDHSTAAVAEQSRLRVTSIHQCSDVWCVTWMLTGGLPVQASTTALLQVQNGTGGQPSATEAGNNAAAQARSLHIQAAKVVTAHAATVGDNLLGVPLLAAAGLPAEAASLLQVTQLTITLWSCIHDPIDALLGRSMQPCIQCHPIFEPA